MCAHRLQCGPISRWWDRARHRRCIRSHRRTFSKSNFNGDGNRHSKSHRIQLSIKIRKIFSKKSSTIWLAKDQVVDTAWFAKNAMGITVNNALSYSLGCVHINCCHDFSRRQAWCRRKNMNIRHLYVPSVKRWIRRKNCDQSRRVCHCRWCHQTMDLTKNRYFSDLWSQLAQKNRVRQRLSRTKSPVSTAVDFLAKIDIN